MVKKFAALAFILALATPAAHSPAAEHAAPAKETTPAHADVAAAKACKYCGMDREKFSHSRMLVEFDDGSSMATCSLHCTAVDLANSIDKTPKLIKVADFGSKELIDAEKAVWVIGGNKQGVMTKNAKWAFAAKEKADAFVKENGGRLATFDDAVKSAYEDMYNDTKMIREKRKMMKQGKKS